MQAAAAVAAPEAEAAPAAAAASEGEKGSLSLPFGLTSLEELSSLYQGLPGALLKEGPPSALYLGVYEAMKARLLTVPWLLPFPLLVYLLAGALGETVGSVVRAPAEAIKARVQSGVDDNTGDAVRNVLLDGDGRANVLRAWTASIFRDVPFGGIQLAVFEGVKAALINGQSSVNVDSLAAEAVIGAFAASVGSFVTTPPDVVTVRILTQKTGGTEYDGEVSEELALAGAADADTLGVAAPAPVGFGEMAANVFEEGGAGAFLTGWQARVGYWAPAIGIFLSCYCFIRQLAVTQEFFV